jgi:hypothetical protein
MGRSVYRKRCALSLHRRSTSRERVPFWERGPLLQFAFTVRVSAIARDSLSPLGTFTVGAAIFVFFPNSAAAIRMCTPLGVSHGLVSLSDSLTTCGLRCTSGAAMSFRTEYRPKRQAVGKRRSTATVFATVGYRGDARARSMIDSMVGAEGFEPPTLCSQI